jgi:2',3'-cyclic-nucleotide 2'-phosphodiesterase (5'-nucleotidase family)
MNEKIGNLSQYDCLRVLPFANNIVTVNINGTLLQTVLAQGLANAGHGSYLVPSHNVQQNAAGSGWLIDGVPLDANTRYTMAVTDYLLLGEC